MPIDPLSHTPRSALPTASFHSTPVVKEEKKEELKPLEAPSWWDPMYSVPLGIAAAVPMLHYEWYVVNEETQLMACFIAFTMIVYKNFGSSIHEMLEEDGRKMLEQHNAAEDAAISALKTQLESLEKQGGIVEDAKSMQALRESTYAKLQAAGKIEPLYKYKAQMERLLNLLSTEEAALVEKQKQALMQEATLAVQASFAEGKTLQKASLDAAIGSLEGKAAKGGDPVQQAFLKFFQQKAKDAQSLDAAAEIKANREVLITKANAVARNEGFFFELDESGKPKMVV